MSLRNAYNHSIRCAWVHPINHPHVWTERKQKSSTGILIFGLSINSTSCAPDKMGHNQRILCIFQSSRDLSRKARAGCKIEIQIPKRSTFHPGVPRCSWFANIPPAGSVFSYKAQLAMPCETAAVLASVSWHVSVPLYPLTKAQASFMLLIIGQRNVEDIFFFKIVLCASICVASVWIYAMQAQAPREIRRGQAPTETRRGHQVPCSLNSRKLWTKGHACWFWRTSALNFSATALTQYGHLKITGDTEIIYFYVLYFYGLLQSHNSHFKRTGWSMTVSSQCHLK